MKKFVLGLLIGLIIAGGVGVIAYSIASKDVSYNNTNSGSTKTNVQDAIDDLYARSNVKKTLLWTNPNPASALAGGNVTLNDSWENYDVIGISFKAYKTYNTLSSVYVDIKNSDAVRVKALHSQDSTSQYGITGAMYSWWSADYVRGFRLANEIENDTSKIRFFNAYNITTGSGTAYNDYNIPVKIYGFKFSNNNWELD